ncbi:ComEC/Rec2 family competence protein [Phenylobacterium sp.]|uniref:ComEC/Rec2 family competence protein n=1 Tax=Phenylobacterium sp. TaxID=1871053 RepID=UPI00271B8DE6|nr:ComEC/Rec2 family competence protein [Phenylobacterium sp.]MDO8379679.1 ComEC/Rec2 family competence protein [Phenylobacterium sp.]
MAAPAEAGAIAAPHNTRARKLPSAAEALAWLRRQAAAQADRLSLWTPVAFGCGAAVYFALPREPLALLALAILGLAGGLLLIRARWGGSRVLAVALTLAAFALGGFAAGKLRTEQVRAPQAPGGQGMATIEAFVVDVASPGQGGPRLLLAPIRVGGLVPEATPIRARMTLQAGASLPAPGTAIRVRGMLNPPPPPASPGSYDFARDAFFEGIGGVGFTLTQPREIFAEPPPWRLALEMRVNAARWALARKIVDQMGVESGGLAAAMVTGHEAFVPREQVDALRAAGLAHIISISGLHMAIVGGFAFAGVRLLIAAWPWLALRLSSKKAAALAGFAAVLGYLVLSGAPAPAERAAITACAAFGAILVDRRAISLHTLAIAALAILALQPEAVTEPGFQMSFAATTALVALAELWPRPVREINAPWPIRGVQAVGTWLGASLAASFVAGLATGPFAMQHFNRVSTFGLAANLLVAPISSFLMMPALALGAVLAPLGLGEAPLGAAGVAIDAMNRIAAAAASLPHAQIIVASAPAWTLPAAFLGILWLCLWKGPLRWAGLPLALAVTLTPRPPAPDIWIAADGSTLAVREGKQAVLFRPDVKLFGAELWARRRGLEPAADGQAARDALYDCDRWSCAPRVGSSPRVAAVFTRRASTIERKLPLFCQWADVVVVRGAASATDCPGVLLLTEDDFARGGSAELYRTAQGWKIVWAQTLRGRRPWTN